MCIYIHQKTWNRVFRAQPFTLAHQQQNRQQSMGDPMMQRQKQFTAVCDNVDKPHKRNTEREKLGTEGMCQAIPLTRRTKTDHP